MVSVDNVWVSREVYLQFTVALSRAQEGLFILGNAENLSQKSKMWRTIIQELKAQRLVGTGLPIACHRHPEEVRLISQPGQLAKVSPDGMSYLSHSLLV